MYVPNQNGIYSLIEEKGWIYPTESMLIDPIAGNLLISGNVTPKTLHLTGINLTPDAESTRDSIRYGPKRPPKTVRELLNERRRNTPTTGSGYQSVSQTPTIRELMADKTKLAGLTLETSPALQEYLDHEHQLHLQMIEEKKQLEDFQKQKIQDQLEEEERRRKLEEQEIARQRAWEEHQQKKREKKMKEIEQQCLLELEQRAIQADLEKARREKLEAEQRKAELEAQVKAIEEEKLKEEQRIRQEDRERKHQQQEAERILKELGERRKRIVAVASHHEEIA